MLTLHLILLAVVLLAFGVVSILWEIRIYRHNRRLDCFASLKRHSSRGRSASHWKRQVFPGRR